MMFRFSSRDRKTAPIGNVAEKHQDATDQILIKDQLAKTSKNRKKE
jgi:hypothetical protein